jgi:hypothetical protein
LGGRNSGIPGDEMVLEAAVNGRADALVTFNGTMERHPTVLEWNFCFCE